MTPLGTAALSLARQGQVGPQEGTMVKYARESDINITKSCKVRHTGWTCVVDGAPELRCQTKQSKEKVSLFILFTYAGAGFRSSCAFQEHTRVRHGIEENGAWQG